MNKPITLLEVPLDPRYRVKVRVYAFDPPPFINAPALTLVNPETNAVKSNIALNLRPCENCATTPAYAEADLPPGREGEHVSVYVTVPEGAPSWAFATVTNNDTQQVTIVTPAGGSGLPCNPCEIP